MALLTQELLKKKLSSWMLSSKVVEHLGFDETQASEVKQELEALVEMGLVERDGQRRGLKFRFICDENSNEDEQDSDSCDGADSLEDDAPTAKKIHDESASLRAYFADKEHTTAETAGKTPLELLSVLTEFSIKDPSILSHTLAYKRTAEGNIIVTFWSGCVRRYEKEYTLPAFMKVLKSELKALSKPVLVA